MQTRFNPFELRNGAAVVGPLMRDFDFLFHGLAGPTGRHGTSFAPPADIFETQAGLTLQVDLPGHDPKTIEVKVEQGVLTFRSERKAEPNAKENARRLERGFGVYTRSFTLPDTVDATKVEARYEQGVLTLTLPRKEESKPRVIEVKVQG
ncbi:Hsp20/alpha crystallin family protein [Stigmatella sp. ncwal1]|uniref:Hsp20/alpha crystallin family protein n=1 Tax=Stigmatella ashevillensis TaxID=2995309 RepID=A0ABT5DIM7_9BACT|nr:Hsp20/alpha crystallin family protein [Stigmatella ashevillena]MDC0713419.1 Hsp20/alpha crystallin family protein [Stigmatella ashevillena]